MHLLGGLMKLFFLLSIISLNLFANMSAIRSPSQEMSDLFVLKNNNLRVLDEKIFYEIDKSNFNAKIRVIYTIKNEGYEFFDESFYFIYPNTTNKDVSVKIDGEKTDFQLAENFNVDKLDVYKSRNFRQGKEYFNREKGSGFIFPIKINPMESKIIEIEYVQVAGFSKINSNSTFAIMSHYRNMFNTHNLNKVYSYYLYPINSFSNGVDKISIQIKYPKKDNDNNDISIKELNTKLKFQKEENGFCIYEETFTNKVPVDILSFELESMSYSKLGFTIAPTAFFIESEDENTWAVFSSLDYVVSYFQLSVGVLSNFDEKFQIYQEIKFFPDEISHYIGVLFDYRYSLGLVEQISPQKLYGMRFSVGLKIMIPVELTYQVFPPFTNSSWNNELFFNIPFSF
jgi:hypothetical protein